MKELFITVSLLANLVSVPEYQKVEAVVTGYASLPELTDSTPLIMANNQKVFFGAMACPRKYAFGTIVKGLGEDFVCTDRMNRRYEGEQEHFDIWFDSLEKAKRFGRQKVTLFVYPQN